MAEGYFNSSSTSGQHSLYYRTWGNPQGRPLVCVHGLTGSSNDFKYVGELLGRHGYHVVALDIAGRGRSDFLTDPLQYNFDQYLHDIRAFMNHLGISKADWLGVSMGGLLGMCLAGMENSPIERMILSDVGPDVPQDALDFIAGYLTLSPAFSSVEDVIGALKQSKGTPFYRGDMSDEHWQHYALTHVKQNDAGLWVRAFDPQIAVNFRTQPLGKQDLWEHWGMIHQPVLTLRGELSTLLTEDILKDMHIRKPGHDMGVLRIPGAGHVPSLYPEEQIRPLLEWLGPMAE